MNENEIVLTSGIERAIEDLAEVLAVTEAQREQFKLAFCAVLFALHQPRHSADHDVEPDSYDQLELDAERTVVLVRCN